MLTFILFTLCTPSSLFCRLRPAPIIIVLMDVVLTIISAYDTQYCVWYLYLLFVHIIMCHFFMRLYVSLSFIRYQCSEDAQYSRRACYDANSHQILISYSFPVEKSKSGSLIGISIHKPSSFQLVVVSILWYPKKDGEK